MIKNYSNIFFLSFYLLLFFIFIFYFFLFIYLFFWTTVSYHFVLLVVLLSILLGFLQGESGSTESCSWEEQRNKLWLFYLRLEYFNIQYLCRCILCVILPYYSFTLYIGRRNAHNAIQYRDALP